MKKDRKPFWPDSGRKLDSYPENHTLIKNKRLLRLCERNNIRALTLSGSASLWFMALKKKEEYQRRMLSQIYYKISQENTIFGASKKVLTRIKYKKTNNT
ncbi:MAG: hypothetical protein EA393_15870 [Bacteroidetes bacterium]|nr:MAG: hypothetical protein EA393_15870 [Bacteroidota bacterium]